MIYECSYPITIEGNGNLKWQYCKKHDLHWTGDNKHPKVYTPIEITNLTPFFKELENYWYDLNYQYTKENPEKIGSCVIGAGFQVHWTPPRKRKAYKLYIVQPMGYQSCVTFEATKDRIAKLLKDKNIECFYNCGRLD